MTGRTPRWVLYGVIVAVHLGALAVGARQVSITTQILLMPALALVAVTIPPSRFRTWTLVALGFSWLGDALPQFAAEQWMFPLMLASFLLAHVAWIAGFWPVRRESALWRKPATVVPYLVVGIAVLAWCIPGAGVLAPALVVYAVALLTTACLATAFGWPGWWGGALFIISDSLIAIQAFTGVDFAGRQMMIMGSYAIAHGLLVLGVMRRVEGRAERLR